jgi:hypothetical protein
MTGDHRHGRQRHRQRSVPGLWARGFRHLLPGESMASSASDNFKIRRFSESLFSLYDGLVRLPNAMPGRALETLLAEIAALSRFAVTTVSAGGAHDPAHDPKATATGHRVTEIAGGGACGTMGKGWTGLVDDLRSRAKGGVLCA